MSSFFINDNLALDALIGENPFCFPKSSKVLKFHESLDGYLPTPVVSLPSLSKELGLKSIWVKNEACRIGLNSFKILGASYAIHKILAKNKNIHSFCTATEGNHGKAVARIGKLHKKNVFVFVPEKTSESTVENLVLEGAFVKIVKGNYDKAVEEAYFESLSN